MARATFLVRGRVHGVGFRWWTRDRALELGLVGHVRNMADGRVEVCAQGGRDAVEELERLLREQPTASGRPGHVDSAVTQWGEDEVDQMGFVEK
jgi:acylphosphatase